MPLKTLVFWLGLVGACAGGPAASETAITITYLKQEVERPPVLSNLDAIPEDEGWRGAEIGLQDNATTGKFLGQTWSLQERIVPVGGDLLAAGRESAAQTRFLIIDAPREGLLALADLAELEDALLFNVAAEEPDLRDEACRANVLHTATSLTMRSDALMQFLALRRWSDFAMITGPHASDLAFAEALRGSARKFGLKIKGEKEWRFDANMRRAASAEVPLFTQELPDHDVLLAADEIGDFARYLPYNTWDPVLLAGSEGLRPLGWSHVMEQWGAVQLQNRFEDHAGRNMRSKDYAAWAAVRALGEAVTRTASDDPNVLRAYMLSDEFELAAFKGRPLSFRSWNGQLRQPIPVVHPGAVVAVAPLEGFLHPTSELDTLGLDAPQSRCTAFSE